MEDEGGALSGGRQTSNNEQRRQTMDVRATLLLPTLSPFLFFRFYVSLYYVFTEQMEKGKTDTTQKCRYFQTFSDVSLMVSWKVQP
ncbi:hypothetical protein Csa_020233 [Cucumis sativus]|uniref:Uncharacterized protein n=1 Tax=Cucumis sativus TaxID=3659 RepID=A0A0A0K5Q2_CUCSA|nr:hypothetical protein Csa_020233 [Cucumis sativus]